MLKRAQVVATFFDKPYLKFDTRLQDNQTHL